MSYFENFILSKKLFSFCLPNLRKNFKKSHFLYSSLFRIIQFSKYTSVPLDPCRALSSGGHCITRFAIDENLRFSLVGLSGLEPPTSRLSGVRSNRLSYKPVLLVWCISSHSHCGGDEEDRTPDLLLARQALSQLSYTPIFGIFIYSRY